MRQAKDSDFEDIETRAWYDWSVTTPSDAVVDVVAGLVNGGPTSFGPLYDCIDPDALDAVFRSDGIDHPTDETRVSFFFAHRFVVVHGNGEVVVRATTRDAAG